MLPTRTFVLASLGLLAAAGCGGGGGGSSAVNVPVSTSWTSTPSGSVPTGLSERITVHPLANPSVVTSVVNVGTATGTQTTNISLAAGQYLYHVDLYSGAGQSGTITGSLDAVVNTANTSSVTIAEGQAISAIDLAPSGVTVSVGGAGYVYAGPKTSTGAYTFASPTDISFLSSNTTNLTVAKDTNDTCAGDLLGIQIGSASITASAASSPTATSPPLTVSVGVVSGQKLWTIMVFLNASNDLCPEALPNYLQMQKAALSGTNTQIIVAWKESKGNLNGTGGYDWSFSGQDDTRYYLVQPSNNSTIVGSPVKDLGAGVDFGVPSSVNAFIAYCKKNYPANHYLIDMWDHGDGWQEYLKKRTKAGAPFRGISYDYETGNHIESWQMDQCFTNGNNVDVLSYDACNMQMLECGYQVRNYVNYIVGSEDLTPGPGYDYSVALLPFFTNPTGSPATLSQGFVNQMVDYTAQGGEYYQTAICQSVVDAGQLSAVAASVNALGQALLANKTAVTSIVQATRNTAKNYEDSSNPFNMYFDAISVAQSLQQSTGVPTAVSTAAGNVVSAVQAAVLFNRYDLENLDAGSNGLAFDFSNGSTFTASQGGSVPSAATQYSQLALATAAPNWYNWLLVAP